MRGSLKVICFDCFHLMDVGMNERNGWNNSPKSGSLSEKVDEEEGNDARRTGSRTAHTDKAADGLTGVVAGRRDGHERRSGSVTKRVPFAGHLVPTARPDTDEIADAQTDVARRQEDERPFRIP